MIPLLIFQTKIIMKNISLLICLCTFSFISLAQQTLEGSITHDGLQRTFISYIPENYTGNNPVPLVFNFHGYGSSADAQMWYGDFRSIADSVGFIIVHPQGTIFDSNAHWNVGGWTVGSTTDDVGFTNALLDSLSANYNIDLTRVYSTGMSNGGYMSFLLACQLSDRIAAIASVTGSMTPETFNDCNPQRPVPVLQIHGTDDSVVPYNGDTWTRSIEDAIDYWVDHNNCNTTASVIDIPDIVTTDGSTVEHFIYEQGNGATEVEHFKITGGDHTWPDNPFGGSGVNKDINGSIEVWKFFSKYDINGLIMTTSIEEELVGTKMEVYPNPSSSQITIRFEDIQQIEYQLSTTTGQVLMTGEVNKRQHSLNLESLPQGVYFLKVGSEVLKVLRH